MPKNRPVATANCIEAGDSLIVTQNDRRFGLVVMDITDPLAADGARLVTGLRVGIKDRRPNQSNSPYKSFWTDEVLVEILVASV